MSESIEKKNLLPRRRFPEFANREAWKPRPLSEVLEYEQPTPYLVDSEIYEKTGTAVLTANKSFILGYTSATDGIFTRLPAIIFDDFTTDKKFVVFPFKVKSSAIKILLPKPGLNLYFLHEAMRQISFVPQDHKRHWISQYQQFSIPVPGHDEQRKIAECLESLDELIAAEAEKLEALKRHKKGLLQQLFPAEGETTPRLRFPDFSTSGEWLEGSIGELGDVVTGTTPSTAKREFYGKDVLFASPADISAHRIVSETANGLSTLGAEQARLVAPGSSLFVCIGSTIGKVAQNAEACATNQQINTVVADRERFDADFVYYLLLTKANIVRELAGKQAVPLVSKTVFCSVKVEFPLIDEQRAVASVLNELDRAQSAGHHSLEVLRNHKDALMQQLFPNVDEAEVEA